MNVSAAEWFTNWFSTPYYAILYQHRNEQEAHLFLQKLINILHIKIGDSILDVGCGEGRHADFLQKSNFNVYGFDISPLHIANAKKRNELVHFFVHDMRKPFPIANIKLLLNLFTSFGYFDAVEDDLIALQNMYNTIDEKGTIVIDFLNEQFVRKNLIANDIKTIDGITFQQSRKIESDFVYKTIFFKDYDNKYQTHIEKVRLYKKENIETMLKQVGFNDFQFFGNYNLDTFNLDNSPRLIIIAHK